MIVQLQLLNKILDSSDSTLISLNNLTEEFFSDYPQEFQFIKEHIDKYGNCPDKETFLSKFPDFDVIQVNETTDYLIDELFDDRNKRNLAKVFNKVRDLLNKDKVDEAMQVYASATDTILKAKHLESVDIIHDTSRYERYVEKISNFNTFYVKTGFPELDKIIGGWDRKEELATIIARTNQGKSWILLKTALAAAEQGLNVGIYSGEMSEDKVGYRIDTLYSHISNGALTHGSDKVLNDYKRYIDSLSSSIKGHIRVFTPEKNDGLAGVTALRGFIEKEGLDMLCIDQHSLLSDDRHARNPVERAANISRDLKTLQVLKKIPIITVSQMNREKTDDGKLDTTQIAQSDRIGQDSTIIIGFAQKDKVLTMTLLKSRDSSNGAVIKYALDLDHGIFRYIPIEGDANNGEGVQELYNEYEYNEEESQPF